MHSIIYRVTFLLLFSAWIVSIIWFFSKPDYEPALSAIALLASITGVFAERWHAKKELREQLFGTLIQEIQLNKMLLKNPPFKDCDKLEVRIFFPRLYSEALDRFIYSSEFLSINDRPFLYALHRHKQVITQVNRKINAIELKLFMYFGTINKKEHWDILIEKDGPIEEVRNSQVGYAVRTINCGKGTHSVPYLAAAHAHRWRVTAEARSPPVARSCRTTVLAARRVAGS
jgi:hypothetical protein